MLSKTKLRIRGGKHVDLAMIKGEDLTPERVAHALGNLCRFNGHTDRFYSVAEHCVHAATMLEEYGAHVQFAALLHDAAEAITGDITTPLGRVLGYRWELIKRDAEAAIVRRFEVDTSQETKDLVKWADTWLLGYEGRALLGVGDIGHEYGIKGLAEPDSRPTLRGWTPVTAGRMWLLCYEELKKELDIAQTEGDT